MPLVVHRDGNLYYASRNLEITRLTPEGKTTLLVPELDRLTDKLGGIKGLASGPDDTLFATCPGAVLRIRLDGTGSVLVHRYRFDCGRQTAAELRARPQDWPSTIGPSLQQPRRAAASSRSHPTAESLPVLGAESHWFPTGVAVRGPDLYVLNTPMRIPRQPASGGRKVQARS
jgi:hypothetical protein